MEHLVADWAAKRDPSKPGESLMLAGTRADVKMLNTFARDIMKSEHRLCNEHSIHATNGTLALRKATALFFVKMTRLLMSKTASLRLSSALISTKKGELVVTAKIDGGKRFNSALVLTLKKDSTLISARLCSVSPQQPGRHS